MTVKELYETFGESFEINISIKDGDEVLIIPLKDLPQIHRYREKMVIFEVVV